MSLQEILEISNKPVPGIEAAPTDTALSVLSECDTLPLWSEDLNWARSLEMFHSKRIERHFGEKAIQDSYKATVFGLPGVTHAHVPIHGQKFVFLTAGKEVEQIEDSLERRENVQIVIFLLPFSKEEDVTDAWQPLIQVVPKNIRILLVPAYSPAMDFAYTEVYSLAIKRLTREEGELVKIAPDEMIHNLQNRNLISHNGGKEPKEYWKAVGTLIEERGISWPRFEVIEKDVPTKSKELEVPKERSTVAMKKTTPTKNSVDRRELVVGPVRKLGHEGKGPGPYAKVAPYQRHPHHGLKFKSPFKKY